MCCKHCGRRLAVGFLCACVVGELAHPADTPHNHEDHAPVLLSKPLAIAVATSTASSTGGMAWHVRRP